MVLIELTNADRAREMAVLSSPQAQLTDGLILSPMGLSAQNSRRLAVDYPLVVLGSASSAARRTT